MDRRGTLLRISVLSLLLVAGLLWVRSYWRARAQQEYRVLDTTREQFLGEEPGALGSTSVLTFTSVARIGDGEVGLLPLGVVGDWETLASPLLDYPIETAAAVAYHSRIYLIGGYKPSVPTRRLDTVWTCDVQADGSLCSDWITQTHRLPKALSSPAAALSTQDASGDPITPTLYVLGGRKSVGTSDLIYYAHIDPVSLDIGPWMTSTRTLGGARWGLSAVANDGLLYAAGGSDGSTFSTAVWHYPIEADGDLGPRSVDNDLPDDSNSTYHQAVLVPSIYPSSHPTDTVYLIGGRDDAGSTQHVLRGEIYPGGAMEGYVNWVDDPGDDLPAPLSAFAAALGDVQGAGRQVYVIGGDQGVNGGNPQKTIRSAVMDDLHNVFADWYGRTWFTSPALPEPRYYHTAVQVGEYIYAISGRKASSGPDPYYRNVLRGKLTGTGARQYAPSGAFTSRVVDLGQKHRLVGFDWNTTITPTDPGVSLTLQFRAGNDPQLLDATGAWSDLFPSDKGADVSNSILAPPLSNYPYYPPIGRYVQYRALFTTTAAYSNVTPLLREVGVRVEETPNLYVSDMRVSCNGCYGSLGVVSRTITLQLTVSNLGRDVPNGNNFFTCLFITTSATYDPFPPDWPSDAGKFLPGSYWWGLQGTDFTAGAQQTLTTTFVFAQPINIWLYAYADYNDTSQPPDYDVGEADPQNLRKMYLVIIDPNSASATQTAWYWGTQTAKPPPTNTPDPTWYWATQTAMAQTSTPGPTAPQRIFLPLVQQRFSLKFYLQLTTGESLPVPLPLPQPSARGPAPEAAPPNPSAGPLPPSQGP